MMTIPVPAPISGGLILSYKCSAACRHCMYACSPAWKADWIAEADLEAILEQLARTIQPSPGGPAMVSLNHGLHFTGGEPFLDYDLLCRAVEISRDLRIPSTFVETNGAWCTDDRTTREKLSLLKEKGLKGIMISVNPFYLEYVPFERTERAIRLGLELFGANVMVYQLEYYRRFRHWEISGTLSFEEYLQRERKEELFRNVEFFMMGRAPYALEAQWGDRLPHHPAERLADLPCSPPVLREWHNHFDNYANYVPGFCGGISLGDARRLDDLLREGIPAEEHPVLACLVNDDFRGLLEIARSAGYRAAECGYLSKCHLCLDLRRHLVSRGGFPELAPRELYDHLGET
jgi:hypothetical protein